MKPCHALAGVALVALLALAGYARAESAQDAAARGQTLLARGDFNGALAAYASAVKADRENRDYVQRHAMIRRVIQLRKQLDAEQDAARWEYLARGLHAYYINEGIYPEALALDKKIHARLANASSAVMLAETQLALERNADAVKTLSGLGPDATTPGTQALLGLALAREGKADEARRVAASITLSDDAGPRTVYSLARLKAKTGSTKEAIHFLVRCFKATPPSVLDGYKEHAKACPDFAELAATDEFAEVLKTESDVPESKCSGGAGCAGCPMRGKCAQGQNAEK
jgi:tetratricopeptide (TPR) repeat protein